MEFAAWPEDDGMMYFMHESAAEIDGDRPIQFVFRDVANRLRWLNTCVLKKNRCGENVTADPRRFYVIGLPHMQITAMHGFRGLRISVLFLGFHFPICLPRRRLPFRAKRLRSPADALVSPVTNATFLRNS